MSKSLTLKQILSLNPQIDEKKLKQSIELLRKLRQVGINKRGYNLISPYSRHRHKLISKENKVDPRTIQIGLSPQR